MCKGQQELTKELKPVTINVTKQADEQKEKEKTAGPSAPVPVAAVSAERNRTLQQNQALIQRMARSFNPINARAALPDAEVVQTAGKSNYKINKEKKKIARARNSVADEVSYDLKLEANRHLTAVHPALNSVIEADHIDMTKEENVYHCAIAQSFMKETENNEDKLFLRNFLSDDTDTRYVAFHRMMESIRSIEVPEEELTPNYMLSHLEEMQNIKMRVEAFDNFRQRAESGTDASSLKDKELFSSLSESQLNELDAKIRMGRSLAYFLDGALLQKGLRYMDDPDSPFSVQANGRKYEGLFQGQKLDYCSREEASKYKKNSRSLMEAGRSRLRQSVALSDAYLLELQNKQDLTRMVVEKARNTPVPESVSGRVQNADAAAQLREMFQRDDVKAYFQAGVEASNKDWEAHKNDSMLSRLGSARLKLGLRSGRSIFKDAMTLAFKGMNESMQEYFNSLRLNCIDIAPMLQKVDHFGLGGASFGCGIQEISKGFFKVFREYVLSPAGIELCRNMCEQMSGARVFYKDGQPDLNAIMQDMYTNFTNAFFAGAFLSYQGTYQDVAVAAQNVMMKSLTYVPDDRSVPENLPGDAAADVTDIISSFRNLTTEVLSRF